MYSNYFSATVTYFEIYINRLHKIYYCYENYENTNL